MSDNGIDDVEDVILPQDDVETTPADAGHDALSEVILPTQDIEGQCPPSEQLQDLES